MRRWPKIACLTAVAPTAACTRALPAPRRARVSCSPVKRSRPPAGVHRGRRSCDRGGWPQVSSFVARAGLAHFNARPLSGRTVAGEAQCLLTRIALEQKKSADEFLGFGERTIHHALLSGLD